MDLTLEDTQMSNEPRHAPPKGKRRPNQELLYDPDVPTSTHAEQAKTLVDKMPTGTLCTMSLNPAGYPYGSFVTYAIHNTDPVFLVSQLAEHTKNLNACERASLLVAEAGPGNPLALGRVTLVGSCSQIPAEDRETVKEVFLSKHPSAKFYVDFKDFAFFKLEVAAARYIGGFGRMSWLETADWVKAEPDPIAPFAKAIIDHMNEDHADIMVLYCKIMSKAVDTTEAQLVGVDRYGFEMSAMTAEGPRPIRLPFSKPVSSAEEVRHEMVALAKQVRAQST
jgi:putative heme iron utilization protein